MFTWYIRLSRSKLKQLGNGSMRSKSILKRSSISPSSPDQIDENRSEYYCTISSWQWMIHCGSIMDQWAKFDFLKMDKFAYRFMGHKTIREFVHKLWRKKDKKVNISFRMPIYQNWIQKWWELLSIKKQWHLIYV